MSAFISNALDFPNLPLKGSPTASDLVMIGDVSTSPAGKPSQAVMSALPFVLLAGDTMTGPLILNADPTNPLGAVTKQYADSIASGITVLNPAVVTTTANLNATYSNGALGVGATLTNAGAQAAFSSDGVSPSINSRVLVKDQTAAADNGMYTLTTVGTGATNWVLTRSTDYNTAAQVKPGTLFPITQGTKWGSSSWVETATVTTMGTDSILFSLFNISPSDFLQVANNLSDVANQQTALNNLMPTSPAQGNIVYFNGTNWVALATSATVGAVLQNNGAASNPTWSNISGTYLQVANNLSDVANRTTSFDNVAPATPSQGNILYYNGTHWVVLATSATAGTVLQNNGAASNPTWSNISGTYLQVANNLSDVANRTTSFDNVAPATPSQGNILYYNGTHWVVLATSATAGTVLQNNGTASNPTWSNISGTYLQVSNNLSDVANRTTSFDNVAPVSPAQGNILYYNGTHWVLLATSASAGTILTNNGTGTNPTWSAPAGGGGGLTLVGHVTASNSVTVNFDNLITSTYEIYFLSWDGVTCANNSNFLELQLGTGGGPTYITANYQGYVNTTGLLGTTPAYGPSASFHLMDVEATIDDAATSSASGEMYLFNLTSSALWKMIRGSAVYYDQDAGSPTMAMTDFGSYQPSTSVITSIRFKFDTNNILAGNFYLYGLAKT
ncbi:hypothetical protein UFOVP23_48 [uncultured Caudovirales phage]|uniref:Uncharacterized protein n=1 Tax=uncultured Caudovirales phage TaxID=2100421 RepID=A0A6J5T8W1_9CAUD|nr:hypothetical protein UFOVP23_48 [uncultured Caudovirales phage]